MLSVAADEDGEDEDRDTEAEEEEEEVLLLLVAAFRVLEGAFVRLGFVLGSAPPLASWILTQSAPPSERTVIDVSVRVYSTTR